MKKEFNLSEKRKELLKTVQEVNPELTMTLGLLFRDIEKQDKEFIKRLKEEIGYMNKRYIDRYPSGRGTIALINKDILLSEIDKLAGDKLSK